MFRRLTSHDIVSTFFDTKTGRCKAGRGGGLSYHLAAFENLNCLEVLVMNLRFVIKPTP